MDAPQAKKALGQHWLEDDASLNAMVQSAGVEVGDTVLEIGPGYGTLTEYLLATGADVTALEFDASLISGLLARFADVPEFSLQEGDIRSFDFGQLPLDYKLVANIPYYLTSHLIQLISETPNQPSAAVLLIQKEVAERVAAQPGDMSLLGVTAQFHWQVSLGPLVPAALFTPPPKVDSRILILKRRPEPLFPGVDAKRFFRVVKAGFSQKRKTLLNSLSGGLAIDKPTVAELLAASNIESSRRAQTLSLDDWYAIYREVELNR